DATVANLDPAGIAGVLRPKVDGALHLHRLTAGADLAAFVLFSSAAGTVGSAGQAVYAAAHVVLGALAVRRQRGGVPATSVAWGLWESDSAMTGALSTTDLARMAGSGLVPMPAARGLALLDLAIDVGAPNLVAAHIDQRRLATRAGDLPPILSDL